MFDEDIKIADLGAAKPKKHDSEKVIDEYTRESKNGNIDKAKALGKALAQEVVNNLNSFPNDEQDDVGLVAQRGIMMTFAATVAIEENIFSAVVRQSAQNSFNSRLQALLPEIYKAVSDSGAFSFYYLAYRRGTEVVRRMGQTFAMLCSHDGDPVYHELGEAIYCWFKSLAESKFKEFGLN